MISSRKGGHPFSLAMSLASKARTKADQSSNSLVLASLRLGRTCSSTISPSLRRMTLVGSSFQSSLQWIQCTLPSFTPARSWASACRVVTRSRWDCRSGWARAACRASRSSTGLNSPMSCGGVSSCAVRAGMMLITLRDSIEGFAQKARKGDAQQRVSLNSLPIHVFAMPNAHHVYFVGCKFVDNAIISDPYTAQTFEWTLEGWSNQGIRGDFLDSFFDEIF